VDAATFQWLYHAAPDVPLNFDTNAFRFRYTIGETQMLVQHIAARDDLTFQNLPSAQGMVNPITGEDLRQSKEKNPKAKTPLAANHVWISHRTPKKEMRFLSVLAPFRSGESEPQIERIDDAAVKVTFRGQSRIIAFDGRGDVDLSVDTKSIR